MIVQKDKGIITFKVESKLSLIAIAFKLLLWIAAGVIYIVYENKLFVSLALVASSFIVRHSTYESAMAVEDMGIQIVRRGLIRFKDDRDVFIPVYDVLNVVINEVFQGFQVVHVLQVIVKDKEDLVLVFETLNPPLDDLEVVWNGFQQVLRNVPS